jgi:Tfp pilus assembly protein PilX
MKRNSSRLYSERGSLLLVSMLLCSIIGISIASYIRLGVQAQKLSNRALYNNGAINLAERGMEEAMYSINKMVNDPTYTWTDWTAVNSGADARRKWTGYTFDQNATGQVRVYVENYQGSLAPVIIARSTVTLGGQSSAPIEKWIKVTLAMTSKFANGLVAKNTISFSGTNASVDSWDSKSDDPSATPVPYDSTSRDDNGSVGSISVTSAVSVNNADIFGYVATGGTPASIGPNGLVGPFGTTAGTIAPGHSSTDFTASFDNVSAPTTPYYNPIGSLSTNTTHLLPGSIAAAADGKHYIECPSITKGVLKIEAGKQVILKMTGDILLTGGSEGIVLESTTSKLIIYTAGDVKVTGQGIANGVDGTDSGTSIDAHEVGQPANFQIWGTKTSSPMQDIQIAGNGALSGIVYAPFGSVTINGNGAVCGSVVANDIKVTGNAAFHYDESLGRFGGNPFRVAAWRELTTAAERNVYSTKLTF